jgi:hypothetical protein
MTPLSEELKAIALRYPAGAARRRTYVALGADYEGVRDGATTPQVRDNLNRALHLIWRRAQRERDRR